MSAAPAVPSGPDAGAGGTTPLARILMRRIAAGGPITLAEYMAECLLHPEHGYYATRDPFGAAGDFTTAPEISQMFGELIGLALAQSWIDQGAPPAITLAELGPGRGTLMADILRATRRVPGFHAAAAVWLVEASGHLRQVQRQTLVAEGLPAEGGSAQEGAISALPARDAAPGSELAVRWADTAADLPADRPLFLVANEFFDALPIRQFQRAPDGWAERLVGIGAGGLAPGLSAPSPVPALARRLADTGPGDVVEICPAAAGVMAALGQRVAQHGGALLLIDYGGWHSLGDTFQALSRHERVDPFAAPGEADLTAHVDFEALALAAPQLRAGALTGQGAFLQRLGIGLRAEALGRGADAAGRKAIAAALGRLTLPEEMGTLFKVLGLVRPDHPLPSGIGAEPGDPTIRVHNQGTDRHVD